MSNIAMLGKLTTAKNTEYLVCIIYAIKFLQRSEVMTQVLELISDVEYSGGIYLFDAH